MEHYIAKIRINKLRHLENVNIELSSESRCHLILTGKNGSGKTSLLEILLMFLKASVFNSAQDSRKIFLSGNTL